MGRITVFTADDCQRCHQITASLKKRGLPFFEISVTRYPHKRKDMLSLTNQLEVPQIFLNEAKIGNASDFRKVVASWDSDPNWTTEQFVESFLSSRADPKDPRLQAPTEPPVDPHPPAPPRGHASDIKLPDGSSLTVFQMTNLLLSIFPCAHLHYHMKTYKNCFRVNEGVDALKKQFGISREEAVEFGLKLQKEHFLLDHVCSDHDFSDTPGLYFRLQCHQTPHILNSYRIWGKNENPVDDAMALLGRLTKQLDNILSTFLDPSSGEIDYKAAATHRDYPAFEEAVCELQGVDLSTMDHDTKRAFSINLHNTMMKYGFVKVGMITSESSRHSFMSHVHFQLGPHVFSFEEFLNGIMRGNRKKNLTVGAPFGSKDERLAWVWEKTDPRIHFALTYGSKSCPPVEYFTPQAIDEELRVVAELFCCRDDSHVRMDKDYLYLSHIFQWYQEDFGKNNAEVVSTLATFLRGEKKQRLEFLMRQQGSSPVSIKYLKYNWSPSHAKKYIKFTSNNTKGEVSRLEKKSSN